MKQDYCCYANSKLYIVGKDVVLVSCLQRVQSMTFVKMKITRMNVELYFISKDWYKFKALSSRWEGCPGVLPAKGPLANSPSPPWAALAFLSFFSSHLGFQAVLENILGCRCKPPANSPAHWEKVPLVRMVLEVRERRARSSSPLPPSATTTSLCFPSRLFPQPGSSLT